MENVLNISNRIWKAMEEKNELELLDLIHEEAEFVHMTRTLTRKSEINVILENDIVYKHVEFIEHSIRKFGTTEIILNRLDLTAVVKGNEVVNAFVVTEVYTPDDANQLKLASLAFTKRV